MSDKQLRSGDIRLRIGGIEVADQLSSSSELESNNFKENSVILGNDIEDEELNGELGNDLNDGSGEESADGSGGVNRWFGRGVRMVPGYRSLTDGSGEELAMFRRGVNDGSGEEYDVWRGVNRWFGRG